MSVRKLSVDKSGKYDSGDTSSVYKTSGEHQYTCDPCRTVGDHAEAKGFCTNCDEYLCDVCFKCHSRSKTSRHHALLDKDNMPRKPGKLCESCRAAGSQGGASRYCTERKQYFCNDCFETSQRYQPKEQHVLHGEDNVSERTVSRLETSIDDLTICHASIEHEEYNVRYTYLQDVNIKAGDEKDCYIAEMTLVSSTELLLTDYNNKSLKLVDVTDNTIKGTMRLQSSPIGITTICNDQVAVVLENESKIQIISISGGLFVLRTLNTNGNCVDVKYINGKLYVSFWEPVKFQIIQPTGVIYKTIRPEPEVLEHCILPSYIDVSRDESLMYLSDWKTKKVMCIDMYGNMISMFQGELKGPADVTISPFGSVYLCDRDQHIVYKLTSDLREATVILRDRKECASPHAMCFNIDKHHLYISSGSTQAKYKNYIKIYHWK